MDRSRSTILNNITKIDLQQGFCLVQWRWWLKQEESLSIQERQKNMHQRLSLQGSSQPVGLLGVYILYNFLHRNYRITYSVVKWIQLSCFSMGKWSIEKNHASFISMACKLWFYRNNLLLRTSLPIIRNYNTSTIEAVHRSTEMRSVSSSVHNSNNLRLPEQYICHYTYETGLYNESK